MAMTKSRKAGGRSGAKRFTPVVADLVQHDEIERYIAEHDREIDALSKEDCLGAAAYGKVVALQFKFDVLMNAAFGRIAALEADLKKAKASPRLTYKGPWRQGQETHAGEFVTFQGSVWHCNKKTLSRPGDDPEAYTLAVKSGRDGKDAAK